MQEKKSIEQLENDFWKDVDFPTDLVKRCFLYRKIPIGELTAEQLRTLIGQNIGLEFLIPIALEFLKKDILLDAEFYEGDLLNAVLDVDQHFLKEHTDIFKDIHRLVSKEKVSIEMQNTGNQHRQLLKKVDAFLNISN
jgi:hypothetical protein